MDGHFVPNITFGPLVVRAIHKVATVPLDVHLMIRGPRSLHRGVRRTPGPPESRSTSRCCPTCIGRCISSRSWGRWRASPSIPSTPVGAIEEIVADLDYVLVMSVNPGFGGQTFIPRSESKVRAIRQLLDRAGSQAPDRDRRGHRRVERRARGRSRGGDPRGGPVDLRSARCRRARCASCAPPHRAPQPDEGRADLDVERPRAVRGNRQDGRRLLRQLLRLVRGRRGPTCCGRSAGAIARWNRQACRFP